MPFPDPVVRGNGALIKRSIHSPDYVAGTSGWSINKDGTAEFADALVRGGVIAGTAPNQVIIGPAADLPPPLDTYLLAGIVCVAGTRISYTGIRDILGVITTEMGFVNSLGTIIPMVQQSENGSNQGIWSFLGGTDGIIEFLNAPWMEYEDPFENYTDGLAHYTQGAGGAGAYHRDVRQAFSTYFDWTTVMDSASLLGVDSMTMSSTGIDTSDYQFTQTTYGTTPSLGTHTSVGAIFIAPWSQKVKLEFRSRLYNSAAGNTTWLSPEVRAGGTIGAGAVVLAPDDTRAIASGVTTANPGEGYVSGFYLLTGLTIGATYNARLLHKVNAGTGRTTLRELIATPSL